jgi:hypothetical protein
MFRYLLSWFLRTLMPTDFIFIKVATVATFVNRAAKLLL